MKTTRFLPLVTVLMFVVYSCDRASNPMISADPVAPSISSELDGESFELTEDMADDILFALEWQRADFGFDSAVEYIIQISETGDNFETLRNLGRTNSDSFDIIVSDINTALLAMGFSAGEFVEIQFRVVAQLDGARFEELMSESVSMSFRPYLVVVEFPEIYVPGNYQSASGYGGDWSPPDAPPLFSFDDDGIYEGYVYMAGTGNEYKFTDERSWDLNWGDSGDGTLVENGPNNEAEDSGFYRMVVNLNSFTYETTLTEWGIVGDATPGGWDADTVMEYNPDEQLWTITADLTEGEMKFRANNDWDFNYGDDDGNMQVDWDGSNIPVETAGNYTISLNLKSIPFSYQINQN